MSSTREDLLNSLSPEDRKRFIAEEEVLAGKPSQYTQELAYLPEEELGPTFELERVAQPRRLHSAL